MNAVLRAYRAITIRPGESVQLRVLFQETCADESIPCRRIIVEAAADELINLEVLSVQGRVWCDGGTISIFNPSASNTFSGARRRRMDRSQRGLIGNRDGDSGSTALTPVPSPY